MCHSACVCLCVNQGSPNRNCYTKRLVILHGNRDTQPGLFPLSDISPVKNYRIHCHRIHRCQQWYTTGLSRHRLSPYNAYYLKYTTLCLYSPRFQVMCDIFLKVLIKLQLILHCDNTFQWSTTLLLKTNFLTWNLNLLLNSIHWHQAWKHFSINIIQSIHNLKCFNYITSNQCSRKRV